MIVVVVARTVVVVARTVVVVARTVVVVARTVVVGATVVVVGLTVVVVGGVVETVVVVAGAGAVVSTTVVGGRVVGGTVVGGRVVVVAGLSVGCSTRFAIGVGDVAAFCTRRERTSLTVSDGFIESSRAARPATWGDAIEVPEIV